MPEGEAAAIEPAENRVVLREHRRSEQYVRSTSVQLPPHPDAFAASISSSRAGRRAIACCARSRPVVDADVPVARDREATLGELRARADQLLAGLGPITSQTSGDAQVRAEAAVAHAILALADEVAETR